MLDGLEEETGTVITAEAGEGRHRRDEIGEQFPPHRHDRVLGRQFVELVPRGPQHGDQSLDDWSASGPKAVKKQE